MAHFDYQKYHGTVREVSRRLNRVNHPMEMSYYLTHHPREVEFLSTLRGEKLDHFVKELERDLPKLLKIRVPMGRAVI